MWHAALTSAHAVCCAVLLCGALCCAVLLCHTCSMRKNFLPFSCGARNATYMQRSSKALPTTDTLNTKEDEFIAGNRVCSRTRIYT
jgi:hypothetical protein